MCRHSPNEGRQRDIPGGRTQSIQRQKRQLCGATEVKPGRRDWKGHGGVIHARAIKPDTQDDWQKRMSSGDGLEEKQDATEAFKERHFLVSKVKRLTRRGALSSGAVRVDEGRNGPRMDTRCLGKVS